jgi:ferrochelatase
MKKTAVVLFNLGGPDKAESIYPFLVNFFMDPNIIPLPKIARFFLARGIALYRSRGPAKIAYGLMGGRSPILENTLAQQEAVENVLRSSGENVKVFTCMRYWHPMADEVVRQVKNYNPDELVLVTLYPQLSSATFWSSLEAWNIAAKKINYDKKAAVICCYPREKGFVAASVENIHAEIKKCQAATGRLPRILFSAHSIPTELVEKGDPYDAQCTMTVEAILKELDMPGLDIVKCYQSKVGPKEWLGPQTVDEIIRAGKDDVPVIIYPHAFVCEHVETIVELGIEYAHVAENHKVPYYGVVKTVSTHPKFIEGLTNQIKSRIGKIGFFSDAPDGVAICPPEAKWCCRRRAQCCKAAS